MGLHRRSRQGFTLTELAITLVLAGLFAGLFLKVNLSNTNRSDCKVATQQQLHTIHEAMTRFVNSNDRFPMPAQRTLGVEDKEYGREAALVTLDSTGGVAFGALPFQALGLAPSFASDCWGNKFSYAVTIDLTDPVKYNSTAPVFNGAITIKSSAANTVNGNIAYAIISHGANGIGAVAGNYTGVSKQWCALGPTLESENCEVSNTTLMAAAFNDGASAGNNSFDDVIVYNGKNPRAIDGVCDNTVLNSCAVGTLANPVAGPCGTSDTWQCLGINGGATDNCAIANAPCPSCPSPWAGPDIPDTTSVTAYSVASSANCAADSEVRTCAAPVLSGSYTFETCTPIGSCTAPWGAPIADGDSVIAYSTNSSANCAAVSETRSCTAGVLSGSFNFETCVPLGGCIAPWGAPVADGGSVTAYSVASSANCAANSETRSCTAGVLSGSFTLGACTPPGDCMAPWGVAVPNGNSVTAYSVDNSANCAGDSETRTCAAGVLLGSFTFGACAPLSGCPAPWGGPDIASGASVTAYSTNSSANCAANSETRTCTAGVLSGSFTFGACAPPGDCIAPWGVAVPNGNSVTAYSAANSANCATISETRTCTAGVLSGSFTFGACASGGCMAPWGVAVPNGGSVTAYSAANSANCAGDSETRTCAAGVLSGSFTFGGCAPADCSYNAALNWGAGCNSNYNGTVASGSSFTSVNSAAGYTGSITYNCTNGAWSLAGQVCNPVAAAPCGLPWGGTIADGASVTAYSTNTSANCAANSESRVCNNGSLSGSYTNQNCSAPAACGLPWGGSIADGASVTAYSVASSANCGGNSETRTCTAGVLSGSYTHQNCSAPADCTSNACGNTTSHGSIWCEPSSGSGSPGLGEMQCNNGANVFLGPTPTCNPSLIAGCPN